MIFKSRLYMYMYTCIVIVAVNLEAWIDEEMPIYFDELEKMHREFIQRVKCSRIADGNCLLITCNMQIFLLCVHVHSDCVCVFLGSD